MKIVIDIPDGIYDFLVEHPDRQFPYATEWFRRGTPLPQPFDLDGLKSDMKALNCGYPYGLDYLLDCLKKRLGITIIEADKEVDE